MSTRNRTQFMILGLLTFGPRSGYGLKKEIETSVGYFWQESFGQLYPTLRALEEERLIEIAEEESGGRGKKTFRITESGRAVLREWLVESPTPQPMRNELLLKLFLGSNVPLQVIIDHLEEARREYAALLRTYESIDETFEAKENLSTDDVLGHLTLTFGLHRVRAGLAWAEEALERVRALRT